MANQTNLAAVEFLRGHVRTHFGTCILPAFDLPGYYALVHSAWRLSGTHPQYPPEGCWWKRAFWGPEQ
jgi:hypothetical protein